MVTAEPFQFPIPPSARTFDPFASLPVEVRHAIWELCVSVPGMHFLRLVPRVGQHDPVDAADATYVADLSGQSGSEDALSAMDLDSITTVTDEQSSTDNTVREDSDDQDDMQEVDVLPAQIWRAALAPLFPAAQADLSYYMTLNKQMACLSATCADADRAMKHLLRGRNVLRLRSGSNRVISLDCARDVVCLDYAGPEQVQSGCAMPYRIDCPELAMIRRVAVRYCHAWETPRSGMGCSHCGVVYDPLTRYAYPVHLAQFLARHFPRLEAVYFIDYLILRNTETIDPWFLNYKAPLIDVFKSGGRTFYEVKPGSYQWKVQCGCFSTMAWLQRQFRSYAAKNKMNRSSDPAKVEFKILACEWEVSQPRPSKQLAATARNVSSKHRGVPKRQLIRGNITPAQPMLGKWSQAMVSAVTEPEQLSFRSSLVGYHFGDQLEYEFTFRCQ